MARPKAEIGPRVRRVLAMIPWLWERGEVPVREVADRFGLSEEQVVRDLGMVGMFGFDERLGLDRVEIDIWDDDDSGETVVHAFRGALLVEPPRLTHAGAFAVLAAGRALLAVRGADPSGALATALDKLEGALDARGTVAVTLEEPEHLPAVRDAVERRERLDIGYWSQYSDEVTERAIDPLSVFTDRGHWLVLAFDHRSGEIRSFRLDRVQRVSAAGVHFEHEPVPVPDRAFVPGPDVQRVTVVLPATARWVLEAYDADAVDELDGGRFRAVFAMASQRWLERVLVRVGPGAEVVAPAELQRLQGEAAARVLARYGSGGG